ncbi:class I SAM-dependent rRNA methyltransferase [Aeropyrum camini]|uniref:Predicted SAM-dependent methyltransferase n=1 Tax=Aeropyrum camini SY1 = JCM 12091 TaxID=1198449 RepID=U3TCA2_9CREN|nr:class I SAM-dependent rRNA methyltransferase [Aeropyrum camini]BAN89578.1 predicted SAM-dependent methyltransferase [Aeropyrum camini SY1 = JCM 12091]
MVEKVVVSGLGASKAARGSSIIYRKWVRGVTGLSSGDLVEVVDTSGRELACGLWEEDTPVAVRILHWGRCIDRSSEEALERALESAYQARVRSKWALDFNSYRLINSDGDRISGLIVDIYGDIAVVQSSSPAVDRHLNFLARAIRRLTGALHVYEKSVQRSRLDIGLEPRRRWLIGGKREVVIEEGPARFYVDVVRGQKTGFFLDQRINRLEISRIAWQGDKVLDVFSYTGGFGIHALLSGASKAVFIEEDEYAVKTLRKNLRLNGLDEGKTFILNTSVWKLIKSGQPDETFDLVTVDPPAFIQKPGAEAKRRGLRAYRASYLYALERATDGATVYLSSCSYFLTREDFISLAGEVASILKTEYRIMGDVRGASPDHVFRGEEYLSYLKGVFIHIDGRSS